MAMSMSARSRSAPALLSTLISGAGSSASYPGTEVGEYRDGTAQTFNLARADFDAAWKALLPTLTEADFQRWRDARDWTAKKYAMWERGELLPSQKPSSWMGCPCGERFDSHDPAGSYVHREHIYAAQTVDGIRR
jgi:hypothetical protein